MEYLKAAISLRTFLWETNFTLRQYIDEIKTKPNKMWLKTYDDQLEKIDMEEFSNEYVKNILKRMGNVEMFLVTDIANMDVNGKELFYLLLKGYHSRIEKGMVFYQVIDRDSYEPSGFLQFSNLEDNIFYTTDAFKGEESSCNAMETDKSKDDNKSIVFFIGHLDEERLFYDIQRLIFDTVNNVARHPKIQFDFIISVARYGGSPSMELLEKVQALDLFIKEKVHPEYPNASFTFTFEQDAS